MTLRRCDADEAWAVLRRASQQFNIKLRVVAQALIEHISGHATTNGDERANADSTAYDAVAQILQDCTDALDVGRP